VGHLRQRLKVVQVVLALAIEVAEVPGPIVVVEQVAVEEEVDRLLVDCDRAAVPTRVLAVTCDRDLLFFIDPVEGVVEIVDGCGLTVWR
jgi:hypothetical protein